MQRIEITEREAGRRLDAYLGKVLPGAGLSFICRMLRKKNIKLNGARAEGAARINAGDVIELFFSDETYARLKDPHRVLREDAVAHDDEANAAQASVGGRQEAERRQYLDAYEKLKHVFVVYEDDDFIFIDKPVGVLSQKSDDESASVNEWLVGREIAEHGTTMESLTTFKPAFANRLDRNTSGIMLGGKTLRALQTLGSLIRSGQIEKIYLCLADGHPDPEFAVTADRFYQATGYLIKDEENNMVRVFRTSREGAKKIRTGYRLVEDRTEDMLLEVNLYTGKSHQIRAQLSELGHPVVGDPKYGGRKVSGVRQMLHAYKVIFPEVDGFPAISGREFRTRVPSRFNK